MCMFRIRMFVRCTNFIPSIILGFIANLRFIANSSSCTIAEVSKLLISCLTAIKYHVIRYCESVVVGRAAGG